MKKTITLGLLVLISSANAQQTIHGFTGTSAPGELSSTAKQLKTEQTFDQSLNSKHIGETIKELSAFPHHLGSHGSKAVAENILNRFKSYGFDAHLETYHVLFPTPKTRVLEMTSPSQYTALLKEPGLNEDATSTQSGQLPTYNAWSADGDVNGQLVFVNYGLPQDYDKLKELGIDVKGKIVIAKYGRSWRGIKPKVAQEHGAIGCIIYSDPKDDGYYQGEVYPKGAFKNEYGVQRGSVMDMVIYPGDPLTPGIGSKKNAKRIERKDAPTILKIPVLPISYHDAQPLLASMDGPVAPNDDWRGALPITYHVGPGKTVVHLKLEFNWDIVPAYDVIATIKGSKYPNEWIMRGNHHDAWVNGANDPISGQAAMLEEAKALGDLLKTGWKPKRTIVYCAWDGEEPSLLGSTEYAEDHATELQQKAVVYINSDTNARGFLFEEGSPALEKFIDEITQNVTDPQTHASVFDRKRAQELVSATTTKAKKEILDRDGEPLEAMGSGSDYSAFLQHLGIPSLNIGFGGEDEGGEYHSIYDSYDDYSRFKDPGFNYGVALSQTAGHAILRMADADILPFDFRSLYINVKKYADELVELVNTNREATEIENKLIKANYYTLAADPTRHLHAPVEKIAVPQLDFKPLINALDTLKTSTDKLAYYDSGFESKYLKSQHKLGEDWGSLSLSEKDKNKLNKMLYQAEQQLLSADGLPRRNWFKHTIYAPGFYTGYGAKTLPGIREAIEQRNWTEAQEQIKVAANSINKLSAYLDAFQSVKK